MLLAGVCLLLLLLLFVISTSISISNIVNFVMFVRLPWIAPECYGNLSNMTPESDIYAFGITLWEIFSLGKRPYDWLDPKQVIYSVTSDYFRLVALHAAVLLCLSTCKNLQLAIIVT